MTDMFRRAYRESTLFVLLGWIRNRLRAIATDSRTFALVSRVSGQHEDGTGSADTLETSGMLASLGETLRTARAHSTLGRYIRCIKRYTTASWLYRWLTAEPDSEVIVIDLRDTWTVGPVIAAIDRAVRYLLPAAATSFGLRVARQSHASVKARPIQQASLVSGTFAIVLLVTRIRTGSSSTLLIAGLSVLLILSLVGSRSTMTWAELQDTRVYMALVAAFEPPEPDREPDFRADRTSQPASGEEQTDDSESN